MTEFCIVEKSDHIMTVTINRPERLNALHPPANAEPVSYTHLTLPTTPYV